jgi:Cu/Ag efflux protein CusF
MTKLRNAALFTLALGLPSAAWAQAPVTKSQTVRGTATIEAIDSTTRYVTLKTKDGEQQRFKAPADMARFNELKVGDTIQFTYIESIVVRLAKPGDPDIPTATTGDVALTRGNGPRPGATLGDQRTAMVTVKAIDAAVPSITVLTDDGRTVTYKIEQAKNLEGFKAGDKLAVTYTEALLVSVAPAK